MLGEDTLEVPAGGQVDVPVRLDIAPDAWADVPVRVSVRARDEAGGQATAFAEVTPGRDDAARRPCPGLVRARCAAGRPGRGLGIGLGAEVVQAQLTRRWRALLHDGVSPAGGGFATYVELPQDLTVDLAGEEPVLVAGTILDPQAGDGKLDDQLRAFELLLSEDGQDFQVALRGELSPLPIEQAFVLPAPCPPASPSCGWSPPGACPAIASTWVSGRSSRRPASRHCRVP